MSIARTRERIEKLVLQDDAKVITISGLWGSGKTHLWHSIKKNSKNTKISDARYVSLFGVNDIKSVKEALLRNILGEDKQGSNFRNKLRKIANYISNVTSQFVKGVPAVLDFSDIALPYYLKDSFVVIDDIERLEKELGVIQIMGFINEYISQYQTRFLLIMNLNEMSQENLNAWKVMNEKLVDFEVFHTISPSEAFKIAAEGHSIPHRKELESAISILNIGNIRVIKKILNLSASIVSKCGAMKEGELSRIIPNIVLTAGVYYKAIGIWDNTEEYISCMHMKGFRESENEKLSNKTFDIINRLGLVDAGLIASCILRVIEEYPSYNKELDIIFKRTTRSEKEIIATRKYNEFCTSYYWEFKKSDDEVSEECKSLLDYAEFLSPKDISDLLNFMENKTVLKEYVDKFRGKWIVKQKSPEEGFHSYYNLAEIRHDILPHIATPFDNIKEHAGVKDAIEHVSLYNHAGERERAVFRSSTVSSIKDEIYAFSGTELKDFMSHVGSISQPYIVSSLSLEDIAHKLREAAESIISENRYPRLTFVLERRLDRFISARTAKDDGESSESEPA